MKAPIILERTVKAPVDKVWRALTDPKDMKQWYFDLEGFKPEVGFKFEFDAGEEGKKFRHVCEVTEAIVNHKLAYTWRYAGYEGESLVTFELFPEGDNTRIKLTHEGLETFPPLPDFSKQNFETGWRSIIGTQLKEFVEK